MARKIVFDKLTHVQLKRLREDVPLLPEYGIECSNRYSIDPYIVFDFMDKYVEYLYSVAYNRYANGFYSSHQMEDGRSFLSIIENLDNDQNLFAFYDSKAWIEVDAYLNY